MWNCWSLNKSCETAGSENMWCEIAGGRNENETPGVGINGVKLQVLIE